MLTLALKVPASPATAAFCFPSLKGPFSKAWVT